MRYVTRRYAADAMFQNPDAHGPGPPQRPHMPGGVEDFEVAPDHEVDEVGEEGVGAEGVFHGWNSGQTTEKTTTNGYK